jgi:O-antigen ligase
LNHRYSPLNERASPLSYFCAFNIVLSLLLGGGTRGGFLSDAILQILSLPSLMATIWRMMNTPLTREARCALAFCAALLAVPLGQLLPLPPAIWIRFPGHDTVVADFELIQRDLPWAPLSMSPAATWLSALSLLPPLAVFLAVLFLTYRERRLLSLVLLGAGLASVFLGLLQVAQGPSSSLRFFEFTNGSETVGFFANRNHFAALLYCLLVLVAAFAADAAAALGRAYQQNNFKTAPIVTLVLSFTILVVLIAAQAMARSRAGLILTSVALLAVLAMAQSGPSAAKGGTHGRLVFGATALAIIFSVQFALYRILERFGTDPLSDARIAFARNTIEASKAFMPFGAGLGTFAPVYMMFERPQDIIADSYANHAHNDFLELWLEAGLAGFVLTAVFVIWFVLQSAKVWQRTYSDGLGPDRSFIRAATLIIALLAVHSLVDYPLRTGAMMSVMAFACALLIDPPERR